MKVLYSAMNNDENLTKATRNLGNMLILKPIALNKRFYYIFSGINSF